MRVAAICTSVTLALVPTSTAVAEVEFGKVVAYKGICEPSGAIAFPAGTIDQVFIVANDETNGLKAYRAAGGDPLDMPSGDLNKFLGLNDEEEDNKADFEGATWLNDRAYWIGSHSRSRKGNIRHPRWQLFATRVSAASGAPTIAPTSEQAFNGLLPALSALDPKLKAKIELDKAMDEGLAPDNKGFNIEGLTARADGKSLLLGLRSPAAGRGFQPSRPDPAREPRRRRRAQTAAGPASVNSREPRRKGRSKHRVLGGSSCVFHPRGAGWQRQGDIRALQVACRRE